MSMIRVMVFEPGKVGEVRWVENTLESFQNIVGGHIEGVGVFKDVMIYVNEEGRLIGLPENRRKCVKGPWHFVGTFVAFGVDGENEASLTDKQIEVLRDVFEVAG